MSAPTRARLAWSLFAIYIGLTALAAVFVGLNGNWGDLVWLAIFLAFPFVGALIASRGAGGALGWIALAIGIAVAVTAVVEDYGIYALQERSDLPGGRYGVWFASFSWLFFIGLIGLFALLFPDGRALSRRWKRLVWLGAFGAAAAATAIALGPGRNDYSVPMENPVGVDAEPYLRVLAFVGFAAFLAFMVGAVASVVVRYRRSRGEERQQMKWFVSAVVFTAAVFFAGFPAALASPALANALEIAALLAWATLPLATGFAILRYRLYDIDLVINRAVVFAALAAFITAVYVAVVVGLGALVGTAGDPPLALSILATAIVAVAFQPARVRVQRLANRLVYGRRASPYEALAAISEQAAAARAAEDVLPRVARAVAEGTGAARAEVWVASAGELRLTASWPDAPGGGARTVALDADEVPRLPGADAEVPVRHRGELLGALSVVKPRGESLGAADEQLLGDVAAQAGLVLRNVGLTAELLARLDDLRASRQRLVSAQDEERRRLERNLHDGAQQHLVGLKVKLTLASRQAADARLQEALGALQRDVDEAIEALRDLARGIYPPLLARDGLPAALEAHARKASLPVEILADGVRRYPQDVEAAVYFCCLEALQNVAKYAAGSHAEVTLEASDGELRFRVADDGVGFDAAGTERGAGLQNMSDRVEALGGALTVLSSAGGGTVVSGRVPVAVIEAAEPAVPQVSVPAP